MPERGSNRRDAREECPNCGSIEFQIRRMGPDYYVLCDGECESFIIGEIDSWVDEFRVGDS